MKQRREGVWVESAKAMAADKSVCKSTIAYDRELGNEQAYSGDSAPTWVIPKGTYLKPEVAVHEHLLYPKGEEQVCDWVEMQNDAREPMLVTHSTNLGLDNEQILFLSRDVVSAEFKGMSEVVKKTLGREFYDRNIYEKTGGVDNKLLICRSLSIPSNYEEDLPCTTKVERDPETSCVARSPFGRAGCGVKLARVRDHAWDVRPLLLSLMPVHFEKVIVGVPILATVETFATHATLLRCCHVASSTTPHHPTTHHATNLRVAKDP